MQGIWTTERIREAEGRAFAVTPEGELMRRASFGLSVQIADSGHPYKRHIKKLFKIRANQT